MSLTKGSTVRIALSGLSGNTTTITAVLVDNVYDVGGTNIGKRIFAAEVGAYTTLDKEIFRADGKSYGLFSVRRNKFRHIVRISADVTATKLVTDEFADKSAENNPADTDIKELNHLVVEIPDSGNSNSADSASVSFSVGDINAGATVSDATNFNFVALQLLKEIKEMKADHNELVQKLTENSAEIPPLNQYADGDCLKTWKASALRWEAECLKAGIRKSRMITHFLAKIKGTCGSAVKSSDKYNLDTLDNITPILSVLESKVHGTKDEQFNSIMERWENYNWDKLPEIILKKKREERKGQPDEPTMYDHRLEIIDIRKEVEYALGQSTANTSVSGSHTSS